MGEPESIVSKELDQGAGVPATVAFTLEPGVELVDHGGDGQGGADALSLVEHDAEVLSHPVQGESVVEVPIEHGSGPVVHLP